MLASLVVIGTSYAGRYSTLPSGCFTEGIAKDRSVEMFDYCAYRHRADPAHPKVGNIRNLAGTVNRTATPQPMSRCKLEE